MKMKSTSNDGQYILSHEDMPSDLVPADKKLPLVVYINQARFDRMLEIHKDKYKDAETFWNMFKRDLFGINK